MALRSNTQKRLVAWHDLCHATTKLALIILAAFAMTACSRSSSKPPSSPPPRSAVAPVETEPAPPPKPPGLRFIVPTAQTPLDGSVTTNVFMDTGTGRPESGMYGSNRTASDGRPRYHEGLDIAPLKRDRRGNALDTAHAIADGRVAYLNRRPGASNYGNYIVLTHRDPGVGEIYSLYAHLASVDAGLAVGQTISAGHLLGIIGHTPDLPVARSHLHLETGLIINSRYADFAASRKLTNDHANWNGGNLQGFDPADLYARLDAGGCFDLAAYLATLPTAFRVAAQTSKPIDFFKRYPALWHGPTPATGAAVWVVLDFSEEGLPLSGRLATASELFTRSGQLIAVDEEALDRNGRRLLTRQKSVWRLSNSGEDWLALLLY